MFRRKSKPSTRETVTPGASESTAPKVEGPGPYDVTTSRGVEDGVERLDLGALLVAPVQGSELRLQVNEKTGEVGSVLLAAPEGAMELQAFAAPRNGDLWAEVRPQIAADVERRGGRYVEQDGPFGTELFCQVPAKRPDGSDGVQQTRVIGVNGPRWLLRATLLGAAAVDAGAAEPWEEGLRLVGVRRGDGAMPVGQQLKVTLPPDAQRKQ